MTTEQAPTEHPERRASDALPTHFASEALAKIGLTHPAFADAEIETIDMDAALPGGHAHEHDEQFQPAAVASQPAPLDKEQNKARLLIAKFKGSLDEFAISQVTRVGIDDIKRGDVVEIKTIVGSVYLSIVDRIKGLAGDIGEVLCECRYDLPNQAIEVHTASIILPVCTKNHVITNPDGSQRKASRALKITTAIELPDQVRNLLRENFFVDIRIFANPQKEKLRPIDVVRGIQRVAAKLKGGTGTP